MMQYDTVTMVMHVFPEESVDPDSRCATAGIRDSRDQEDSSPTH